MCSVLTPVMLMIHLIVDRICCHFTKTLDLKVCLCTIYLLQHQFQVYGRKRIEQNIHSAVDLENTSMSETEYRQTYEIQPNQFQFIHNDVGT